MTNSDRSSTWNRGVLWRLVVAAVLCTAATAGVFVFLAFFGGQLILPASRAENAGLNAGVASIAALVAIVAGLAGGVLTAIGSAVGLAIARGAQLSPRVGGAVIGVCSAVGALAAFAFSRPSAAGWAVGALGAVVVGGELYAVVTALMRRSPSRAFD